MKNYIKLLSVFVAVLVVMVGVYAPGLLGAKGGVGEVMATPPTTVYLVFINNGFYSPSFVNVPQGGYIHFINNTSSPRSATALDGTFDSGTIVPGGTWDLDLSVTNVSLGMHKFRSVPDGYSMFGVLNGPENCQW